MERVNVTKAFLPPIETYERYIKGIWESNWLTNNGPLVRELETALAKKLGVNHLLFVGNGTIAIQLAIKALKISGDIITTPFSYCATTTSILWENCRPVFVDINANDFNINADLIEAAITPDTSAILVTHVYGRPCDVEKIEAIGKKYNLKVIYDGAHAFGATLNGRAVLDFGDIATCSFHATKVFHTVEGGCIVCHDEETFDKLYKFRSFGHIDDNYYSIGINGKNSEFHAAMGLSNLPFVSEIMASRKHIFDQYDEQLHWDKMYKPSTTLTGFEYNYAYYPVVLRNEEVTLRTVNALNDGNIFPRRYFYPSLNQLPYLKEHFPCPVSEGISQNVISLPLSHDTSAEVISRVSKIVNENC